MSDLSVETAVLVGVFVTSLLGSLHCVSMCGGIALSVSGGSGRAARSVVLYHLARGSVYVFLGLIAGALGNAILDHVSLGPLKLAAGIAVAVSVLYSGWLIWAGKQHEVPGARLFSRISVRIFRSVQAPREGGARRTREGGCFRRSRERTALLTGFATALLPCGWLYGFVIVATTSGSAVQGGLILFAFFLGTVPALVLGAVGMRALLKLEKLTLRRAIAVLIVALGAVNLVSHARAWTHHRTQGHLPAISERSAGESAAGWSDAAAVQRGEDEEASCH